MRKYSTNRRDGEELIECFCPRCENTHKKFLYWTGRGKPKIYCKVCQQIATNSTTRYSGLDVLRQSN